MKTVALIGCGYWGSKIKKYASKIFNLRYICTSGAIHLKERSVLLVPDTVGYVIDDSDLDGVIIATPVETHYEIAKRALLAGKHIFVEKPITVKASEAEELKKIAEEKGLKIGVNYVQTFSPSINTAIKLIPQIGKLNFIEMSTKHLGRFMDFDVYYLLASHHLSILDMIVDIDKIAFNPACYMQHNNKCTTGSISFAIYNKALNIMGTEFDPYAFRGRLDVSINFPGKEMLMNLYGEKGTIQYNAVTGPTLKATWYNKGHENLPPELTDKEKKWDFDEMNNLALAMGYFRLLMRDKIESNVDRAIKITRILEDIKKY